jgi:hypothetical protein
LHENKNEASKWENDEVVSFLQSFFVKISYLYPFLYLFKLPNVPPAACCSCSSSIHSSDAHIHVKKKREGYGEGGLKIE